MATKRRAPNSDEILSDGDELRHAVLATRGSNATFWPVVDALTWLEAVDDAAEARS
jgi:hypothetical protein